jgi:hypothetical protein
MYENVASLIVFLLATANLLTFLLRWRKLTFLYKKTPFNVDSTKTYFVWDPYGKPRKRVDSLLLLASVAFASPIFIAWVFVILWSMITAYPFLILITGIYFIVTASDYDLLDFAKDFIRRKPTKVGEGDLNLLKQTQRVLWRSTFLSVVIALAFLVLTIALTFFVGPI